MEGKLGKRTYGDFVSRAKLRDKESKIEFSSPLSEIIGSIFSKSLPIPIP